MNEDFLVIMDASEEDIRKNNQGRKNDKTSLKIQELISSMEVGQKFYIPSEYKARTVTYLARQFHKIEGNTRYYKVKQIIKNEKYAVVRIK